MADDSMHTTVRAAAWGCAHTDVVLGCFARATNAGRSGDRSARCSLVTIHIFRYESDGGPKLQQARHRSRASARLLALGACADRYNVRSAVLTECFAFESTERCSAEY